MVRFENYWETDAEGNNLPYLDEIIGKPKKEDSVRLTALRTGQVQLIDAVAYADVERFQKSAGDKYTLWPTHAGGIFVAFNFRRGPFPGQAPAHRRGACHRPQRHPPVSVFGQGDMLDNTFPRGNPWHVRSRSLEYDPDKAKTFAPAARGQLAPSSRSSVTRPPPSTASRRKWSGAVEQHRFQSDRAATGSPCPSSTPASRATLTV